MAGLKLPSWLGRTAVAVVVAGVLVTVGWAWLYANQIRSQFLVPAVDDRPYRAEVFATPPGKVVLPPFEELSRSGIWGFETENGGYTQLTSIDRSGEAEIIWNATPFGEGVEAGDMGRVDVDAYPGDPTVAHGLGFQNKPAPGDLGPQPLWFIDGRRSTWVVIAHGRGTDRLTQSLRILPRLVEEGFPVLVVTYRDDVGAPASPTGLRTWGLTEWRDLDAALQFAEREGAREYILYGFDFGAEVISMLLHESERVGAVRGVIFDAPVLDFEAYVDHNTGWIPGPIAALGKQFARIRFGIEWAELDQIARADQFDVPVLAIHGAADDVSPISVTEQFAAARPGEVELLSIEAAGHGDAWNVATADYEEAVVSFVQRIAEEN
ncbi:MAG: alpha/beta fold hydrolase [Acidimicrobiia bacterium]|nr:MAG: alpha/beta fold hydrolase [Acidimicrobiia bacterium]